MTPDPTHNVVHQLKQVADRIGNRPALVIETNSGPCRQVSFSQLWEQIDQVSVGLRREGLRPGQRAILMIPMSIDLYVALLAVMKLGAVAVFVDPWIGRRQIAAFSAFTQPSAWIGIAKSHLLRLAEPCLRKIRLSVTTGRRLGNFPARRTLRELGRSPGDAKIHPVTPDDSAVISFSSGSSGTPKGANRTHKFLLAQHRSLSVEFPYRDNDVDMPMFPLFALNNLASGMTSIVPRIDFRWIAETNGRTIVEQMGQYGVTTCTASPPFFDRIVAYVQEHEDRRPTLRRILTGGAPVSNRQLETWRRVLPETEIVVVYGSTEAEPVAHVDADERTSTTSDLRPQTPGYYVGRPTSLLQTKLIRIDSSPVELVAGDWSDWLVDPGEIGELVVSGDHVCQDYFNNPDAVRENKIVDADKRVWHRMGDTGYFDTQGRFWLVGRVHSTIVRGGRVVHPQLVEQAAHGDDERIRRIAAVGMSDDALGQRVVVVVESENGERLESDVRSRLAKADLVCDDLVICEKPLPVDPRHNSKIDYNRLRTRLLNNRELKS